MKNARASEYPENSVDRRLSILVGPVTIRVGALIPDHPTVAEKLRSEDGLVIQGLYEPAEDAVFISPELSPSRQAMVLLHELVHVMADIYGFGADSQHFPKTEEALARVLEPALAGLFMSNPKLSTVLHKALWDIDPIVTVPRFAKN